MSQQRNSVETSLWPSFHQCVLCTCSMNEISSATPAQQVLGREGEGGAEGGRGGALASTQGMGPCINAGLERMPPHVDAGFGIFGGGRE